MKKEKKKRPRITRKITTREAEKVYTVEKKEEIKDEEEVKKEAEKKEVEKKNYFFIKDMFKRNGRT